MSVSRIQLASVIARGASLAGTCLMQTTIFIRTSRRSTGTLACAIFSTFRRLWRNRRSAKLHRQECLCYPNLAGIPALEQQRGVGAAKAEGVRQRVLDGRLAHVIWDVVQIAFRVRRLLIDRGRQHLIA